MCAPVAGYLFARCYVHSHFAAASGSNVSPVCVQSGSSHQCHAVQLRPGTALRPEDRQRFLRWSDRPIRVQRRIRSAGIPQHRVPDDARSTSSVERLCADLRGYVKPVRRGPLKTCFSHPHGKVYRVILQNREIAPAVN